MALSDAQKASAEYLVSIARLDQSGATHRDAIERFFSSVSHSHAKLREWSQKHIRLALDSEHHDLSPLKLLTACAKAIQFYLDKTELVERAKTTRDVAGMDCDRVDEMRNDLLRYAKEASEMLTEVLKIGPWIDADAVEESWREYRKGRLTDFESFKHELLRASEQSEDQVD